MLTETETFIRDSVLGAGANELSITVRHNDDYEYPFVVKIGCAEDCFTEYDLKCVQKCINKALRVMKAAHS